MPTVWDFSMLFKNRQDGWKKWVYTFFKGENSTWHMPQVILGILGDLLLSWLLPFTIGLTRIFYDIIYEQESQ